MAELKHYGVLGMRWGHRRAAASRNIHPDHAQASSLRKKHVSELSNDELKKLNNRLQLEKQYKDLTKTDVSRGRKFLNDALENVMKQQSAAVIAAVSAATMKLIKKAIESRSKG